MSERKKWGTGKDSKPRAISPYETEATPIATEIPEGYMYVATGDLQFEEVNGEPMDVIVAEMDPLYIISPTQYGRLIPIDRFTAIIGFEEYLPLVGVALSTIRNKLGIIANFLDEQQLSYVEGINRGYIDTDVVPSTIIAAGAFRDAIDTLDPALVSPYLSRLREEMDRYVVTITAALNRS